jgi:Ca2+-transporting ATPase
LIEARTQLFATVVLIELAVAISCRSLKYPVIKVGIFKNKFLWIAVLSSLCAQLAVLYTPQLHGLFDVTYPGIAHWATALGFMATTFVSLEIGKHVTSRRRKQEH